MQRPVSELDRSDQVKLLALVEAYADISQHLGALDNCGSRFFVAEVGSKQPTTSKMPKKAKKNGPPD